MLTGSGPRQRQSALKGHWASPSDGARADHRGVFDSPEIVCCDLPVLGDRQRLGSVRDQAPAAIAAGRRVGPEVPVLRLQRLAGNRAVRQLLREPAPLLGGLDAGTRQDIQIATANVPADFANEDTFHRNAPTQLKDVDVKYGAKVPTDKAFRIGLQVIAWDMLDPADRSSDIDSPFRDNSTVTLDLDLKQFKGEDGLWQFTYTTTGKPPKHRLLIDYLGPAPKYDAPDTAATNFAALGLKLRSGTAGSFGGDDKEAIYSAVSLLPAAAAAKLPKGLTFVRDEHPHAGKCTPPPVNSDGFYCSADNTITLFDRWTKGSQVRYALATPKVATVLHEIGHAIDNATHADDAFGKALKDDGGTPISGYGAKNTLESYAECFFVYVVDPRLLEALRPNVYSYFAGQFGAATPGAGPPSGSGTGSAGAAKAGASSGAVPKR